MLHAVRDIAKTCRRRVDVQVWFCSQTISQTLPEPATTSPSLQPNVLPLERFPGKDKRSKKQNSNLPNAQLAERMLHFDRDAFTDDAWEGMKG